MRPFLDEIAEKLLKKYINNMQDVCVVLPSKRSVVFLKNYLSKRIEKPIFLPEIFSIEEFVVNLSGLDILDNISLQFRLYKDYSEYLGSSADSFDDFINWSNILLNDFNDIDRSLGDAKVIYNSLRNAKDLDQWAIDDWSFSDESLSKTQKKYLEFYEGIYDVYRIFTKRLLLDNLAYQGLAYRSASKNIVNHNFSYKKIWFVGLNALTVSEQNIIDFLKKKDIARVFWDADTFYYDNINHQAGDFLRYQRNKWHEIDFQGVGDYWSKKKDSFQIISCSKNISQVKVVGELLSRLPELDNNRTAVVLADESLLFPLLHHLPSKVKDINVTMGSPLKDTVLFSFIQTVFNMQIHTIEYDRNLFYYNDIINLIEHPYFIKLTNRNTVARFKEFIFKHKIIFLTESDLSVFFSDLDFNKFFVLWTDSLDAILLLEYIVNSYYEVLKHTRNILESEILVVFNEIIILLKKLITESKFKIKIKTLQTIFNQLVSRERVPFQGEPLKGIQIMGILETRTLDFENIIMLSVNEGFIPQSRSLDSFIPYDIKKYFKLPVYSERDALFSYHFYRLLQRSKKISLVYNSETDGFGNGEKSRFITQLLSEYKVGKIDNLVYKGESSLLVVDDKKIRVINKGLEQDLRVYFAKGVSPSAINKYNNCSLSFYYHYIADIRPKKEIQEFTDSAIIGNVIHEALAKHYSIDILLENNVKENTRLILNSIEDNFLKFTSKESISQGKNYLNLEVAKKITKSFLNLEIKLLRGYIKKDLQLNILALEEELSHSVNVQGFNVVFSGFVDRVDLLGDTIRIIDYKTGIVNQSELIFNNLDELFLNPKKSKAFQIMMYAYLFTRMFPDKLMSKLSAGIFSFKNLSSGLLCLSYKNGDCVNIDEDILNEFELKLKNLILRIINDDFVQTEDKNSYEWMDYKLIYQR